MEKKKRRDYFSTRPRGQMKTIATLDHVETRTNVSKSHVIPPVNVLAMLASRASSASRASGTPRTSGALRASGAPRASSASRAPGASRASSASRVSSAFRASGHQVPPCSLPACFTPYSHPQKGFVFTRRRRRRTTRSSLRASVRYATQLKTLVVTFPIQG